MKTFPTAKANVSPEGDGAATGLTSSLTPSVKLCLESQLSPEAGTRTRADVIRLTGRPPHVDLTADQRTQCGSVRSHVTRVDVNRSREDLNMSRIIYMKTCRRS